MTITLIAVGGPLHERAMAAPADVAVGGEFTVETAEATRLGQQIVAAMYRRVSDSHAVFLSKTFVGKALRALDHPEQERVLKAEPDRNSEDNRSPRPDIEN